MMGNGIVKRHGFAVDESLLQRDAEDLPTLPISGNAALSQQSRRQLTRSLGVPCHRSYIFARLSIRAANRQRKDVQSVSRSFDEAGIQFPRGIPSLRDQGSPRRPIDPSTINGVSIRTLSVVASSAPSLTAALLCLRRARRRESSGQWREQSIHCLRRHGASQWWRIITRLMSATTIHGIRRGTDNTSADLCGELLAQSGRGPWISRAGEPDPHPSGITGVCLAHR